MNQSRCRVLRLLAVSTFLFFTHVSNPQIACQVNFISDTVEATNQCVSNIEIKVCEILEKICNLNFDCDLTSVLDAISISQAVLCSKIENISIPDISAICDLDPVLDAISQSEAVLCSKIDNIPFGATSIDVNVSGLSAICDFTSVLDAISQSEAILCSKIENIPFGATSIDVNVDTTCDFTSVLDAISVSEAVLCSKIDLINLSRLPDINVNVEFTIGDLNITAICDLTSVLDAISVSEAVLCSKIENIPFGATSIDVNVDAVCDFTSVLDAISASQEVLCSKIEQIDPHCDVDLTSVLDAISVSQEVLCSKIENIPFGATSIDVNVDAVCDFTSVLDAISASQEVLCSKIEQIDPHCDVDLTSVLDAISATEALLCSKIDNIDVTISNIEIPCAATPIFASTTINQPGSYCLANNITDGQIEIAANDVVLDLNNYRIDIATDEPIAVTGQSRIEIANGSVVSAGAFDGIAIANVNDIIVRNVKVYAKGTGNGILFDTVCSGHIENSEIFDAQEGVQLRDSAKIVVQNTFVHDATRFGFDLIRTVTSCVRDSKAMGTGDGSDGSGDSIGFVAVDGYGNIFENDIANGTQGLNTTEFCDRLVAGFALRGTEQCTKIIGNESANATTSPSGQNIPYGIILEATLENPVTLTAVPPIPYPSSDVLAAQWRPDQKFIALGYGSNVSVYSFDNVDKVVSKVADGMPAPTQLVRDLDWSPDCKYLAVVTDSGETAEINIYEFCSMNCTLKLVAQLLEPAANILSVDWSPNEKYLAIGTAEPAIRVYEFDRVTEELSLAGSPFVPVNSTSVNDVEWSLDGEFIATVHSVTGNNPQLRIYSFNVNIGISEVDTKDLGSGDVFAVAWSPDGKFVAAAGDCNFLRIYKVENGDLGVSNVGAFPVADTVFSIDWSGDGTYLTLGTNAAYPAPTNFVYILKFNRSESNPLLAVFEATTVLNADLPTDDVHVVNWSPDGQYILAGTNDDNLRMAIYTVQTFPHKNVVKNNCVYCNSGNECPGGIGISGSSILNLIINNVSYANPINPPVINQNYVYVTNVFNELFGYQPSHLQNISVGGCEAICKPEDPILLLKQIKNIVQGLSVVDVNMGSASCDLDPVLNAISVSEVILCSKIENLNISAADCNLDPVLEAVSISEAVLCSKIDNIPFGVTSIDVNVSGLSASCDLTSVLDAISVSEAILCSKIESIPFGVTSIDVNVDAMCDLTSVLDAISESEAILCSKIDAINISIPDSLCAPTAITVPTTIMLEGSYCVATLIPAPGITINASNVTLDLSGRRVVGIDILPGNTNIDVSGGFIDGGSDGLKATNASNLFIHDLTIRNSTATGGDAGAGIDFIGVVNSQVKDVALINNIIGMRLEGAAKIAVENVTADDSTNVGFSLIASSTCCLRECKALSTGENNDGSTNIIGFEAEDGFCNIFENCIANGTCGMQTTDFCNRVVAGFALRGAEKCSKIIGSESANACTSASGYTIPYGIILESRFTTVNPDFGMMNEPEFLITLTAVPPIPVPSSDAFIAQWRPDQKYLAIAVGATVSIYSFDNQSVILSKIAVGVPDSDDAVRDLDWSPDGRYLAVVSNMPYMGQENENCIGVYEFCPINCTLKLVATPTQLPSTDIVTCDWSPDGKYLAIGTDEIKIRIYYFDKVKEEIIQLQEFTLDVGVTALNALEWSPDGRFIAVGLSDGAPSLQLRTYLFNPNNPLIEFSTKNSGSGNLFTIAWSPDGKYLAAAGACASCKIFPVDNGSIGDIVGEKPFANDIISLDWSSDGFYVTVGTVVNDPDTPEIQVLKFDRSETTPSSALICIAKPDVRPTADVMAVDWSPDGHYILVISNDNDLRLVLYEALSFPSKNLIKNNCVYCNSGNLCPGGIGISGSSIVNLIIGNTAYSNPISQGINKPVVPTNYAFVTNIFEEGFGYLPSDLQNISVGSCDAICQQEDPILLLKQIKYLVQNISVSDSASSVVCNLDEVLDAVSESQAILCSKIDNLNISAADCNLNEVLEAVSVSEAVLCSKIDSFSASFSVIEMAVTECNQTVPVTEVNQPGFEFSGDTNYQLCNSVEAPPGAGMPMRSLAAPRVTGNNVDINLNQFTIYGGLTIDPGVQHVRIRNGSINGAGCNACIGISGGCKTIIIENVTTFSGTYGIQVIDGGVAFGQASDIVIRDCELIGNEIGFEADSAHNIYVERASATGSQQLGFSLVATSTCYLRECSALGTGAGIANIIDPADPGDEVFGFVAQDGSGNVFEDCAALGTQSQANDLFVTTAGFALRGSEQGTKIINSEAGNGSVPSNSTTIPYGILIESTLSTPLTLTGVPVIPEPAGAVNSLDWSPDGSLLAVSPSTGGLSIYGLDNLHKQFVQVEVVDSSVTTTAVRWSADGHFVATGDNAGTLRVYEWCSRSEKLTFRDSETSSGINAVAWSPSSKHIAVARESGDLTVYVFDEVSEQLEVKDSVSVGSAFNDVVFSPDGTLIAAVSDDTTLYIYPFVNNSLGSPITDSTATDALLAVAWSHDGNFIVTGGAEHIFRLYQFDRDTLSLGVAQPGSEDLGANILSLDWSQDNVYFAIGAGFGATEGELQVYLRETLTGEQSDAQATGSANDVRWSPNGALLAAGIDSSSLPVSLYTAFTFPRKNVIKDNVLYCNSGGSVPSGVGIAGSSIANLVIGNTSYSNPIDPTMVATNYVFVTNIVDGATGQTSNGLQNLSISGCEPIKEPEDVALLAKQIKFKVCNVDSQLDVIESKIDSFSFSAADVNLDEVLLAISESDELLCSKLEVIESKIDEISFVADLAPVLLAISESDELLCSKLEVVQSNQDVINDNVLNVDADLSIHDVTICSKLEVIESKIDEISFVADLSPVLDDISELGDLLCSKLEIIESKEDVINDNVINVDTDLSIHDQLICSKLEVIESKIDEISFVADLVPVLVAISESDEMLCSKLEIIESKEDVINDNVIMVDTDLSIHDVQICSKIDDVSTQVSVRSESICSKLELLETTIGQVGDTGTCLEGMITVPDDINNFQLNVIQLLKTILLELRGCCDVS